ncbi:MAG: RecQ family zinc-binding domain-containing protein, partial [Crocinitomicaceae bacterium]|nr:RecQ family zinc-binding domain-containing protein [Crocinitomicaceae bacterium]
IKLIYNSISNFLKIAIGSGASETYPFDIRAFSKAFSIGISETYHALKLLQLNETIGFSENSFHPTRLKIAIGNSALYKFQVSHDKVANLVTLLTRSYPGIFDRFITIDEKELSKRLKINAKQLQERLRYLEQFGVIDINFQTQLPHITYLHERLPDNYLTIHNNIYDGRKLIEEEKLNGIIEYIKSTDCRSKLISAYFGAPAENCKNCDNCLKSTNHSSRKDLMKTILTQLPSTLEGINGRLNVRVEDLMQALRTLQLEEKINYSDGKYHLS